MVVGNAAGRQPTRSGVRTTSHVLNALSLTGSKVSGLLDDFTEADRSWAIATATTLTGFDAGKWTISDAEFKSLNEATGTFRLTKSGENIVLNYAAIPEPRTAILVALGILALLRGKR